MRYGWPEVRGSTAMPFRDAAYDPETIALMTAALEAAWQEARERRFRHPPISFAP
jgi:hypothetical protein